MLILWVPYTHLYNFPATDPRLYHSKLHRLHLFLHLSQKRCFSRQLPLLQMSTSGSICALLTASLQIVPTSIFIRYTWVFIDVVCSIFDILSNISRKSKYNTLHYELKHKNAHMLFQIDRTCCTTFFPLLLRWKDLLFTWAEKCHTHVHSGSWSSLTGNSGDTPTCVW